MYSQEGKIRKKGSYIYEEFVPTDGTDVKVYVNYIFIKKQLHYKDKIFINFRLLVLNTRIPRPESPQLLMV